ncbi:MAG: 4Fe-4S dicluster domain-containing protein [Thermodesulfobacteriota bacterium]
MTSKLLTVDPPRCTGCRKCEIACTENHQGMRESPRSRIQVMSGDVGEGFFLPSTCQQCADPPCMAACPKGAIYQEPESERVVIQRDLCVGCRMCVSACPIGAMGFDPELGLAYKCDLCGVNPGCVSACEPKALGYVEPYNLNHAHMTQSAAKLFDVVRRQM